MMRAEPNRAMLRGRRRSAMTITLSPDQQAWIQARIEAGEFRDIEEAVRNLLAEAIAERENDDTDDLAWAKPLVDEAITAVERGDTMTLAEFEAHLDAKFGALAD